MNIEKLYTHLLFRSFTMKKFDRAAFNLTCSTSHAKVHLSSIEKEIIAFPSKDFTSDLLPLTLVILHV